MRDRFRRKRKTSKREQVKEEKAEVLTEEEEEEEKEAEVLTDVLAVATVHVEGVVAQLGVGVGGVEEEAV